MQYVLDTTTLSDLMSGLPRVQSRLSATQPTNTVIPMVARGELLYGIRRLPQGRRREELLGKAQPYLDEIDCQPVTTDVADRYADLKVDCERSGRAIAENDLWIAATALALGATLVTRDTDFNGIEGLAVENWSA